MDPKLVFQSERKQLLGNYGKYAVGVVKSLRFLLTLLTKFHKNQAQAKARTTYEWTTEDRRLWGQTQESCVKQCLSLRKRSIATHAQLRALGSELGKLQCNLGRG